MLENVRHTRSIRGIGLEPDSKYIVLIVSGDMHVVCVGLVMFHPDRCQVQLGDMLLFMERKSM